MEGFEHLAIVLRGIPASHRYRNAADPDGFDAARRTVDGQIAHAAVARATMHAHEDYRGHPRYFPGSAAQILLHTAQSQPALMRSIIRVSPQKGQRRPAVIS